MEEKKHHAWAWSEKKTISKQCLLTLSMRSYPNNPAVGSQDKGLA